MKTSKKILAALLSLALMLSLAACGGDTPSSTASTPADNTSSAASSPEESTPASTPAESSEATEPEEEGTGADMTSYPREETLYVGGMQWGAPVSNNPFAANPNYTGMAQQDNCRALVWEPLYLYNAADTQIYPLLADGGYEWNADETEITVKMKEIAKWSDGTPVTANDYAATWDAHVKYQSNNGIAYSPYISAIEAVDDYTIVIKANTENLNKMKVLEVLPKLYVAQKAYLEEIDKKNNGDATAIKSEAMWDAPHSGPYTPVEQNEQKWVIERNDDYWGQDAAMWGKLPVPKYIIHNIYSSNDVSAQAFANGEIDLNQSYVANVNKLWEEQGKDISTYMSDAPYQAPGGSILPSVVFNTTKNGLDQPALRKAIAMATDYDKIISSAATNQSPSFADYPRTLMNWSDAQQDLILDKEALAPLQWAGKDVEGAIKLLDEAGIVDSNGDGNREWNGEELSFQVECPGGWNDYEASLQIVQEAGKAIGVKIETYFPESAQVTDDMQSGNFDITLASFNGGISSPYTVMYSWMYGFGGDFPEIMTTNYGRYYNEEVDKLLEELANVTDETRQKEIYQRINEIYLTDVPSFSVFYRPGYWQSTYEGVWTGFPYEGDGSDPAAPATWLDGYAISILYNLELVNG